jgi:hypothetical protein
VRGAGRAAHATLRAISRLSRSGNPRAASRFVFFVLRALRSLRASVFQNPVVQIPLLQSIADALNREPTVGHHRRR